MIQLSDNTNRWGASPAAGAAIAGLASAANEYPSAFGDTLKAAVSRYVGVTPPDVVTGCGSDNVLDIAIRAYAEAGDAIAWCGPTFVLMPLLARLQRLKVHEVGFRPDGDVDAEALLATGARIIYICSPNNPTGQLASAQTITRLAIEAPGLVIVDEAYAEFSGVTVAKMTKDWERVLVTRTLSKAFGLAGLRAGYGIAQPAVIRKLERARGPFTLNLVAEHAAAAALDGDTEWMQGCVAEAVANRDRLTARLRALGFSPLPSAANFVCVPVADAGMAAKTLRAAGISVRAFDDLPGIGNALRISSAPWDQLEQLLSIFPLAATPAAA